MLYVDNNMAQLHQQPQAHAQPDSEPETKLGVEVRAVAKQKATLMHCRQPYPPRGVTNLATTTTTTTMPMTLLPSDTRNDIFSHK